MKKILPLLLAAIAFSYSSRAALITYNATVSADTSGQIFSFTQFDTTLGTLTAVDLIINSSVPGGNFTLTRASGGSTSSASFNGFTEFLTISDDYGMVFDGSDSPITITVTGNSSLARPSTNTYLVSSSQSLLSSAPYTASIASGAWSFYQGTGFVDLIAGLTPDAQFTANRNITANYDNLFANTSTTLRYTYTPAPPSPVPEPSQVAASLLVIGGLGIYFLRRRRKVASL